MPLDNYLDAMGGIGNLVNPLNMINAGIDADQRQQFNAGTIAAQPGQLQAQNLSNQAQQQAMAANQAAQARQAQMVQDTKAAMANPTSASFAGLMAKYPEQAAAFKDSWQTRDKDAQQNDLTSLGGIVSSINNGRPDLAMASVDARLAANKAAGKDQTAVQALSDALHAGNIDQAKGLASYMIAGAAGPEKLDDLVNAKKEKPLILKDGETAYDENGKVIAAQGEKPKVMTVKNPDGSDRVVQVNPGAAGGGISGKPPTPGFPAFYGSYLAKAEGGAAADGSKFGIDPKAHPEVNFATLTQQQAANMLHKDWDASGADNIANPTLQAIHADTAVNMGVGTAQSMLAASGGDPAKYMQLRDTRYRSIAANNPDKAQYLPGWLNRNANLANYAGVGSGGSSAPSVTTLNGGEADPTANLSGEDLFNALDPATKSIVDAIRKGTFPVSGRNKQTTQYFSLANRVDPSVNAGDYPKFAATMKDFASNGQSGKAVTSLQTNINHAYELAGVSDDLGGPSLKAAGAVRNFALDQTSDPTLARYKRIVATFAPEIENYLSKGNPTLAGTASQAATFDPNAGPDARRASIGQTLQMLSDRFKPIVDSYNRGTNKNVDAESLLGPDATAKLAGLRAWSAGGSLPPPPPASGNAPVGGAQAPQSAAPVQIATRAGVAALAPGTKFLWTDGNVHTRK